MTSLLRSLDRVPFRRVVWIFPLVFLLHEAEEWNGMDWYDEFFVERPASALSLRLWLVLISLDILLVTWVSTRFRSERVTALIMIPVVAMVGANGLEHLWWLIYFEAYAPGVVFGGLVGVPVALYLVRRAVAEELVPGWYAVLFAVYAVVTLALVIRAKNTLPPLIGLVHAFSDWMAAVAGPWLS